MSKKWMMALVILLAVAIGLAATVQARPVAPEAQIPGLLLWDMPVGAEATLVCNGGGGYLDVITQTVSMIELECRDWILEPGGGHKP